MSDDLMRMKKLAVILASISILLCGCTSRSFDSTYRETWQLHVLAEKPQDYIIRVPNVGDYPVGTDGRVKVPVERSVHSWELSAYGEARMMSHDTAIPPYIYVVHGQTIAARISTLTFYKLPTDADGYILVRVK